MKKILIISPDRIATSMAGPGIRYWNFAIELSRTCEVTLLVKNKDFPSHQNFTIVHMDEVSPKSSFYKKFDVMLVQGMTLWDMPHLKKLKIPIVVDLYDPFIFESLENQAVMIGNISIAKGNLDILMEQIYYGDYFICASEKQKDFWIGILAAAFRINPLTYQQDNTVQSLIGVVPFGLPNSPPIKTKKVIKGFIPGINNEDKVVLWWGGVWDWLDPLTLIEAMDLVSAHRQDIKCLIVGMKHPDPSFIPHAMVNKAAELSTRLGLTGKTVFLYDWIPYEERMNFLLEADLAVSLHFDNLETRFAFRTRILDYLWSHLPMIVTKGDTLANLVREYQLGAVIPPLDKEALAEAILHQLERRSYDFEAVVPRFYWSNVIEDLRLFCENPVLSVDKTMIKKWVPRKPLRSRKVLYIKGMNLLLQGQYKVLIRKVITKLKLYN